MKRKFRLLVSKEEEIQSALNDPVIKNRAQDLWLKAYDDYYRKQLKVFSERIPSCLPQGASKEKDK